MLLQSRLTTVSVLCYRKTLHTFICTRFFQKIQVHLIPFPPAGGLARAKNTGKPQAIFEEISGFVAQRNGQHFLISNTCRWDSLLPARSLPLPHFHAQNVCIMRGCQCRFKNDTWSIICGDGGSGSGISNHTCLNSCSSLPKYCSRTSFRSFGSFTM